MGETLFDRSVTATDNHYGLHHAVDETLEETAAYTVHRLTMQGGYDDLKSLRDSHWCNEIIEDDDWLADTQGRKTDKVIINMNLARSVGGRGTLTVIVKAFQRGFEAGIDFETVSKDIHYWRQLCNSNVPILEQIMLWEQMKQDQATTDLFYAFKYLDKNGSEVEITDPATKKLAEMIMRGVESYNEYVPVLTVTYNLAAHPTMLGVENFSAGALLGKVVENRDLTLPDPGFSICLGHNSGNPSPIDNFESLYNDEGGGKIICTADQLRCNSDGSYTLTRCFAKYRAIEKELYVGAGGEYGPYDSGGGGGGGDSGGGEGGGSGGGGSLA